MNYYQILGVSRTASQEEIQAAYYELQIKYHPDANPGNEEALEKSKEINRAYQTLRDAKKRKEYDVSLGEGKAAPPRKPGPNATAPPAREVPASSIGTPMSGSLGDLLGDILNGARGKSTPSKASQDGSQTGSIPEVEIKLTPREALQGAVKTIKVNNKPLRIRITIVR